MADNNLMINAVNTFEDKLTVYEKIIQEKFKVQNAYLLKTGLLGSIANFLAFNDTDVKEYYSKVFQEMHPALADDFNSMLFHSSFYGVNIELAQPAIFTVYFEMPNLNTDNVYYYKYTIPANSQFKDKSGIDYIIPDEIEIYQDKGGIKAYSNSRLDGKKELNIIKTKNNQGIDINLIEYNDVQQLKRTFYNINVPEYNVGDYYYFDINISDYKKINKIRAWINEAATDDQTKIIDINKCYEIEPDEFEQELKIKEANIKYFTFGSNKYDYDLFVDIKNTILTFKTGNGTYGKYLKSGTQIIIDIEETNGEEGNLENMEFFLDNVIVTTVNLDKKENNYTTIVSGFSVNGGHDGQSIESVDSIRDKIFDKIKLRNAIVTEADFETAFKYNNIVPFIDSKFIANKTIIFIFNVLKYKGQVIETTSLNLTEDQVANNPFYPVINIDGKDFISPFYYKRENNNTTSSYIVNPKLRIPLYTSISIDPAVKINNSIDLTIEYDFKKQKSYVVIRNQHDDYVYKLKNNLFNIELNYGNGFKWEVNSIYTDAFCIIKEEMYNFEVSVFDKSGNHIITLFNDLNNNNKYYQLIPKQEFYKYYVDIPPVNYDFQTTTAALSYLEDELKAILSTVD